MHINAGAQKRMMDKFTKYFVDLLRPRTLHEIIAKELREAQLRKLEAESAVEYAKSVVSYNEQRIGRLLKRLNEHTEETQDP
jgi:hypothetical protein